MSNEYILTSLKDGVRIIKFNRPSKKNAIRSEMYKEITNLLNEDATNDAVVVTIFTGIGEYYSSGNDISAAAENQDRDFDAVIEERVNIIQVLFEAFINYPKLLIAVVNGPAVGVAVTTLALCDVVYASDRATFSTPFVTLGLCAEGCSSYLFPRIMGRSKASEMLMLGHKMSAQEAYQFGLISQVVPHKNLGKLFENLRKYGDLPVNSVKRAKHLIKAGLVDTLHKTNKEEMNMLRECLSSEEFFEALTKFATRKSKL